jgi:hypothetical protein
VNLWHLHPGVRTGKDLPFGDRAADWLRNGMGSWVFVFIAIAFMAVWARFRGPGGHDPYPYILLNLFLSMLAALQGAIILISQKRADQIASEDAHHTLQNTELLKEAGTPGCRSAEVRRRLHQPRRPSRRPQRFGGIISSFFAAAAAAPSTGPMPTSPTSTAGRVADLTVENYSPRMIGRLPSSSTTAAS